MLDVFGTPNAWQKTLQTPNVIIEQRTAQSILNNTNTPLSWDTLIQNTAGARFGAEAPTLIYTPPGYNLLRTFLHIGWQNISGDFRYAWVDLNGAYFGTADGISTSNQGGMDYVSRWASCKASDVLSVSVRQTQGGTITTAGTGFMGPCRLMVEFDNA